MNNYDTNYDDDDNNNTTTTTTTKPLIPNKLG
jgi:hypothetical protein